MAFGISFAVIAAVWALLTIRGILGERHLAFISAGALSFVGVEMLATDTATDRAWANGAGLILLGPLAVAGLVGYVRTRYVGVLAVSVIALATVVPQAVIDYTNGALGAVGAFAAGAVWFRRASSACDSGTPHVIGNLIQESRSAPIVDDDGRAAEAP